MADGLRNKTPPRRRAASAAPSFVYGRHPVVTLLTARPQAVRRLYLLPTLLEGGERTFWQAQAARARAAGSEVQSLSRPAIAQLVGDVVHQGVVAQMAPFAYAALADTLGPGPNRAARPPLVLVLDQIQDPHNLGALTRSAVALGATGLVLGQDRSVEMTATAIKASAGAAFLLPVARVVNLRRALDTLRTQGVWVAGLMPDAPQALSSLDWQQGMALVVGAEGTGIRPLIARGCDWLVSLPSARIGSLNASVAGALALYEAHRQRAGQPA